MKKTFTVITEKKALILSGPLGSGKTSFLSLILRTQREKLPNIGIIVNDVGLVNIDKVRLSEEEIIALTDGCVCCDDKSQLELSIQKLLKKKDFLLIEPSGVASPEEIKNILLKQHIKTKILTILPYRQLEQLEHSPMMQNILTHQIKSADVSGLSKLHISEENAIQQIEEKIPKKTIVTIPYAPQLTGEQFEDENGIRSKITQLISTLFSHTKLPLFSQYTHMCTTDCGHHHNHQHSEKHKQTTLTGYLNKEITPSSLAEKLRTTPDIVRAKGTIYTGPNVIRFYNYTLGEFDLGETRTEHIPSNFIGEPEWDPQELAFILEKEIPDVHEAPITGTQWENSNTSLSFYEHADYEQLIKNVQSRYQQLNQQYNEYMQWNITKEKCTIELRENSSETTKETLLSKINMADLHMKEIGDAMTFEDPMIWMNYKHLAYAHTPGAITNLKELTAHCFKQPGYICGKRFTFLKDQFRQFYGSTLEETFDEQTPLNEIYTNHAISRLVQSQHFISNWHRHEFYIQQGRVAKWENYTQP